MNKEENMIENIVVEAREVEGESVLAVIEDLLDPRIVRAIKDMGFTQLTPIQEQAIPYLLEGKDIIGQAQTGTGKTAAFGIPMLQNINPDSKKLQAIVLCPTRELAMQAAEELVKVMDIDTNYNRETIIYATIVVAVVPMLLVYPFIQRYFVKGVMVGSIKG